MRGEKSVMPQGHPGLRERNKQEKLKRIQKAAWQLFEQKGFEATTTREVAELAQVGIGTLFLYVKDKQELLQIAFHETIEETIERAFSSLPENETLLEALLHVFSHFFQLYHLHPGNAQAYIKATILQESTQSYSLQAAQQIADFNKRLAGLIEQFQKQGEIRQTIDVAQASSNFFALYFSVLCMWLSGFIPFEDALEHHLRHAFALQIQGMMPSEERMKNDDDKRS